jgi:hypothetical protein
VWCRRASRTLLANTMPLSVCKAKSVVAWTACR